jgi:hypothetical protein
MTDQPDATIVETRLRWYHLTPDRLVVGLLAMEVLLYL